MRDSDDVVYLSPQECAVVLHHREADALLAVLEQANNAGIVPGVGLRVEDAQAAGFKVVSERFGQQEPYNRASRIVGTIMRPPHTPGEEEIQHGS